MVDEAERGAVARRLGPVLDRIARRPALAALALGLIAALGYPPVHGWWIALPALAGFIALLHRAANWRAAAWQGWVFGWAHLTLANNWIATAFTHQAKMPEFLGWLAVPLLCVYLAIYPALAALSAHLLARRAGAVAFGAVLGGAWIIFEWVRSWAFTGYPWPPLGLILLGGWEAPGLALLLPWLGTYALSGLACLLAAGWWQTVRRGGILAPLFPLATLTFIMVFPVGAGPREDSDQRYTLVQPYIPQSEINDGTKFEEQFQRIARLTVPRRGTSRVVLWPESAIPDYLEDGYPSSLYNRNPIDPETGSTDPDFARRRIAWLIGPQSTLLTGVVNLDIATVDGRRRAVSARNSVIAIDGDPAKGGAILHSYAKAHLVPYGEYLPMRGLLEPLGLHRLVAGTIDYLPGPGPRTLDLGPRGKAGVQICYEIVFSGRVVDRADRPDFIFNPSNDGWFGSWGPPQHLAQARLRAIEEGLPVLRSTTTGISAVIDARGVVRKAVPMGEAAALEGLIPEALAPTLFAQLGNALPLGWAALLIALALGLPRLLALRAKRG